MASTTRPAPVMSWLQHGGGGTFVSEDATLLSRCDEPGGGGGRGLEPGVTRANTHTIMHDSQIYSHDRKGRLCLLDGGVCRSKSLSTVGPSQFLLTCMWICCST